MTGTELVLYATAVRRSRRPVIKRDTQTERFMNVKAYKAPFKGVRREKK